MVNYNTFYTTRLGWNSSYLTLWSQKFISILLNAGPPNYSVEKVATEIMPEGSR